MVSNSAVPIFFLVFTAIPLLSLKIPIFEARRYVQ